MQDVSSFIIYWSAWVIVLYWWSFPFHCYSGKCCPTKEVYFYFIYFYLCNGEDVNPAFFSLQLAHEHGGTNQQEVCHPISVHVQGAQDTSKVWPNLGKELANDGELNLFRLHTTYLGAVTIRSSEYLFPSFWVNDSRLLLSVDSVDNNLSRVVGARCTSHKVFCGPIAQCGNGITCYWAQIAHNTSWHLNLENLCICAPHIMLL